MKTEFLSIKQQEALARYPGVNNEIWGIISNLTDRLATGPIAPASVRPDPIMVAYDLEGVVADIEQGEPFDATCLTTIKRVIGNLHDMAREFQSDAEPVAWMYRHGEGGISAIVTERWPERVEQGDTETPLFTSPDAGLRQAEWLPIESAPKDGRHILLADFSRKGFGFSGKDGKEISWQAVCHYWPNPGEEGFYLSSGTNDMPVTATHWRELYELA